MVRGVEVVGYDKPHPLSINRNRPLLDEAKQPKVEGFRIGKRIVEMQGAIMSVILRLVDREGDNLVTYLLANGFSVVERTIPGAVRALITFMAEGALAGPALTEFTSVTLLARER